MHIADPTLGIFGANGIVAAGLPIAAGAATGRAAPRRRRGRGRVLRRRRGRARRVPRGGEPRRGVAAAGRLLLREQRVRRVLRRGRPARGGARAPRRRLRRRVRRGRRQRRDRDRDRDARRGRRPACRRRSGDRRGHHLPLARSLRGRSRSGTGRPRRSQDWQAHDPLVVHARQLHETGVGVDELARRWPRRWRSELDEAVDAARSLRARRGDAPRLRRASATRPAPSPLALDVADAPVFRTMDAVRTALEAELANDERVFVAGIDVGDGRQRVRPHPRAARAVRRPRARHADLRDRDHGPRGRRGHGGHATRRRAHVPRLRRRVPRPAPEPGRQAALHDRRRGARWRSRCARSSAPAARRAASTRRASRRCSRTSPGSAW